MPKRFAIPCLTCGVPTLNGSRCEEHTVQPVSRTRKSRGVVGRDVRERRKRLLRRQANKCAACGAGPLTADQVQGDHVLALADGGADTDENMQALCLTCHLAKTRMENEKRAKQARRERQRGDSTLWQYGQYD